ncbi:uncharacterized protein LOC113780346 [Coffea eugenioides]|uniref:uncharacterized protein LOC113780346 n=1 Tax=Coffea eugenioides TaxID=49369 RepID=UPI000F607C83|nr:uncharacterized protein LOC113780346 [Coffea eugenioides]
MAGLVDTGFSGSNFTQSNNRQDWTRIWEHIDRLLSDRSAEDMGINFKVHHLGRATSDHALLLLLAVTRLNTSPKPFYFLNCWTTQESFLDVVWQNWHVESRETPCTFWPLNWVVLKRRLRHGRGSFGDIFEKVKKAEEEVAQAECCFDENWLEMQQVRPNERRVLLTHGQVTEDMFWHQKARAEWLTDGDKNTRFFHACVSERMKKSMIHRIKLQCGEWLEREDDIAKKAVSFFQLLFSDQSGLSSAPVPDVIPKLLSEQENLELEHHPSLEEVKDVVFSLDLDSTAGPDGFSGRFFTLAWEIVGEDVFEADFSQYRPISLCTFVNKIISKLLARRLARVLLLLISDNQSSIVQGCQILDNFLLAQELVSGIRRSNRGGNVVLKLDMAKTYDRDTEGVLYIFQGLRQGDLISPTLFILAVKVLSRSINALLADRGFIPFKVPRDYPNISHLAYVDDVMIFSNGLKEVFKDGYALFGSLL